MRGAHVADEVDGDQDDDDQPEAGPSEGVDVHNFLRYVGMCVQHEVPEVSSAAPAGITGAGVADGTEQARRLP